MEGAMARYAGTISDGEPELCRRILVVEDEPLIATLIKEILEESGYEAAVASSGAEALALAFAAPPDLALIDIRLQGPMNGIEVACVLREQLGVPPIFLSGAADPHLLESARLARPAGFLRKPFCPSQVFNEIERVLGETAAR